MTRNAKSEKTGMLAKILGGHQETAHSPKLRAQMIQDHGTPTYTPAAWIANRMGRSGPSRPAGAVREAKTTKHIQHNRTVARVK